MPIERSGPLTWSQRDWIFGLPPSRASSFEDNFSRQIAIAPMPFPAVRAAVRDVLLRHENLRSRARPRRPDEPQDVDPVDERLDEVVTPVPIETAAETARTAERICFDIEREWPIRIFAAGDERGVSRLIVAVDHWAVDGWAIRVLSDDLASATAARAAGEAWRDPAPVEQPIDVARWERSPVGSEHLQRCLGYWREHYERLRRELEGFRPVLPGAGPDAAAGPQFHGRRLRSRRLRAAAPVAAAALRVPAAALYLAAFAAAIGAAEASTGLGLLTLSANRGSPAALRSIRNAVLPAPVFLPGLAGRPFPEVLQASRRELAQGHRSANVEPMATRRLAREILGDLAVTGVTDAKFNYLTHAGLGLRAGDTADDPGPGGPADGTVEAFPARAQGPIYMLVVFEDVATVDLTLRWRCDTGWQHAAEPMLRHIEDLVLYAADPGRTTPVYGRT
ncbi:hypothetical protein ACQP2P_32365 [Dactylosporangium sp. CA-139114]|uniref:hypothetical protein n=1 Tax=Dactylosporangium sp. CA-139114 TaxID=3239931 RepID=UPI003D951705